MSVRFDPETLRKYLIDFLVARSRRIDLSWAVEERALEGCGVSILDCCLQCFLVGLFDFGNELLPKAQEFFRAAVDSGEIPRAITEALPRPFASKTSLCAIGCSTDGTICRV